MIRIVNGSIRIGKRLVGRKDGPVQLERAAEARLVKIGVAEYVQEVQAPPAEATPVVAIEEVAPVADAEEVEETAEEELNEAALMAMEFNALRALAKELGVDTKKVKSRVALVSAVLTATEEAPVLTV